MPHPLTLIDTLRVHADDLRARLGYQGMSVVDKFGSRDGVGTTWTDIYPGEDTLVVLPAVATALVVVSTSADDAYPSGTGARTIRVHGLDGDYLPITEDVELSGTTPVSLTGTYLRVDRAYVLDAGTGETNAGAIEIDTDPGGVELVHIQTGAGQTQQLIYTVPADSTLLMSRWVVSVGKGDQMDVRIVSRELDCGGWRTRREYLANEGSEVLPIPWTSYPEKTDIKAQGFQISGSLLRVRASFSGILVPRVL